MIARFYSLSQAEGLVVGHAADIGGFTTDAAMQLVISGTSNTLIEASADGEHWQNVSDPQTGYTISTIVILDHRTPYYRARVFGYTSGSVTAIVGPGFGRNRELASPTPGPRGDELEEDDPLAQGNARLLISSVSDSASITNTTAETAFNKSLTLTAGQVNQTGAVLRVTAAVHLVATGTPTCTIRFRIGGTTFSPYSGTSTSSTPKQVVLVQDLLIRSTGASASLLPMSDAGNVAQSSSDLVAPFAKDLTTAQVLDITGQWSAADAANIAILKGFFVEFLTPAATT